MTRTRALCAALLLPALLVPLLTPPAPAAASDATRATATPARLVTSGTGSRSAATYTGSFEIGGTLTADDVLPLVDAPVDERVWGPDAGEVAGWIQPADLGLDVLSQRRQGPVTLDVIGRDGNGTLEAGDRVDVRVVELVRDYLTPLDSTRGAADGSLAWDATVETGPLTGRFDGTEHEAWLGAVRADIVALDGDVDARSGAVRAPVLEVPLGRSFPADAPLGAVVVVAAPAAEYVNDLDIVVDRTTGTLVVSADIRGYLPETRDVTTATGRRISTWRLPMQIGIVAAPGAGTTADAVAQLSATSGGTVLAIDGDRAWRGELEPGSSVALTPGAVPAVIGAGTLTPAATPQVEQDAVVRPLQGVTLPSEAPEGRETAAWIAAADTVPGGPPVNGTVADGAATFTVHPDRDGALAITGWHDERGRPVADLVAPGAVEVDGTTVDLGPPDELSVWPTTSWIAFGSRGTIDPGDGSVARRDNIAQIYTEAAYDLEATWHLDDGSSVGFNLLLEAPDAGDDRYPAMLRLRRTAGGDPRVALAFADALAHDDGVAVTGFTREATVPFDSGVGTLVAGTSRVRSWVGGDGLAAIVRDDGDVHGDLRTRPRPLKGPPLVRVGAAEGTGTGTLLLWLDPDRPAAVATPDTVPCGPAEVTDARGDALGGLDVVSARVDDSRDWLTVRIEHASLPAAAPPGTSLQEDVTLHLDNFPMITRITLRDTGALSVDRSAWRVERSGSTLLLSVPREALGLDDGEVIRDIGVLTRWDLNRAAVTDRAPDTSDRYGTGGTHVVGACQP